MNPEAQGNKVASVRKKLQKVGCSAPGLDTLPIVEWNIIWVTNWYDGPIGGLCLVDGRVAYFNIFENEDDEDDESNSHICYTVHALTDEEVLFERAHQKVHEKYYGTRFNHEIPVEHRFYNNPSEPAREQYEAEKLLVDQKYAKYGSRVDTQARKKFYRDREPIAIMAFI